MRAELERRSEEELRSGEEGTISLCSLTTGGEMFCIDTKRIHEVLGECAIQKIPLAPAYIAGVIPNRGAVLTTVSLRALLGLEKQEGLGAVLVLKDEQEDERFGLMVDAVGGVVMVSAENLEANPSTLDVRSKALFDGAYKLQASLMVRLDTAKLCPSRLSGIGIFGNEAASRREAAKKNGEPICEY